MKMFITSTTKDSTWFELKVPERTVGNWREIFEDVDVPAICIEKSQKDKGPTTIDYSLLL